MSKNKDPAFFTDVRLTIIGLRPLLKWIRKHPGFRKTLKYQRWLRGFFLTIFYLCLLLLVCFLIIVVVSFTAIVRVFWQTGAISWGLGEISWDWFWDCCEILDDEELTRLNP